LAARLSITYWYFGDERRQCQASSIWRMLSSGEVLMVAFFRSEKGQGLAEYALILALIAIAAVVALLFLGGVIQSILSQIGAAL